MPKEFSLEKPKVESGGDYRGQILKILTGRERRVRALTDHGVSPILHEKKEMQVEGESALYEATRRDILQTFNVPEDEEHVFIDKTGEGSDRRMKRRAERAFILLIDLVCGEGFYAEGRTAHAVLLNQLFVRAIKKGLAANIDAISDGMFSDSPQWLTLKGFLSYDGFKHMPASIKKEFEEPIYDDDGQIIKTPSNWFLTGSNLNSGS